MTVEEGMGLCRILTISAIRRYGLRQSLYEDILSDAYEGLVIAMQRADESLETDRSQAFVRKHINGHIMHGIRSRFRKNLHGAIDDVTDYDMDAFSGSNDETRRELWDAVERLPPKWRLAVILNLHYGYSQDEIAEMMGVTQMSVSRYVRYGANELAKGLVA